MIEPVATKEFIRQELRAELEPIQRDIKWIRWVMGIGLSFLFAAIFYLHSDTKQELDMLTQEMNRRFTEQNKHFDKIETDIKETNRKLDKLLQK